MKCMMDFGTDRAAARLKIERMHLCSSIHPSIQYILITSLGIHIHIHIDNKMVKEITDEAKYTAETKTGVVLVDFYAVW